MCPQYSVNGVSGIVSPLGIANDEIVGRSRSEYDDGQIQVARGLSGFPCIVARPLDCGAILTEELSKSAQSMIGRHSHRRQPARILDVDVGMVLQKNPRSVSKVGLLIRRKSFIRPGM